VAAKVLSRSQLVEAARRERAAGKAIVFANGGFDLLHVGHVRYSKGTDYAADAVPERAVVAAYGGPDGDRGRPQGSRDDGRDRANPKRLGHS
jgi:bifunctional ADP-heptose synthase (sugar kinase/adenylyltransferase)